ncbi:DUF7310 family coiled-coil domain-containing protein [Halobellus sp. EA9]|uniref:DUF7310 family coiled-coil domain-containing protein n=1 Tax=Halobellus sp. EA9 TaxID=3421647 RepID=UPI003EB78DFA
MTSDSDGADDGSTWDANANSGTDDARERIDRLERRVASLESELDAVRGLLGGVAAVDEAVERRASIALAKAESLEREFSAAEPGVVRERLAEPSDGEARSGGGASENGTTPAASTRSERPVADDGRPPADANRSASSPSSVSDGRDTDDGLAARLRGVLR